MKKKRIAGLLALLLLCGCMTEEFAAVSPEAFRPEPTPTLPPAVQATASPTRAANEQVLFTYPDTVSFSAKQGLLTVTGEAAVDASSLSSLIARVGPADFTAERTALLYDACMDGDITYFYPYSSAAYLYYPEFSGEELSAAADAIQTLIDAGLGSTGPEDGHAQWSLIRQRALARTADHPAHIDRERTAPTLSDAPGSVTLTNERGRPVGEARYTRKETGALETTLRGLGKNFVVQNAARWENADEAAAALREMPPALSWFSSFRYTNNLPLVNGLVGKEFAARLDVTYLVETDETPAGCTLALSPKAAFDAARQFLHRAGVMNFEPYRITFFAGPTGKQWYEVRCARCYDGLMVYCLTGQNLLLYGSFAHNTQTPSDWTNEFCGMLLDDGGVFAATWEHPLRLLRTEPDGARDTVVLQEAVDLATAYLLAQYGDTRVARTATVQRVSLVLCCVPDPNADREGRLLPAWLVQYAYGRDDTAAVRDNLHLVAFSQITGEKLGEGALPPSFDRRNAEER